VRAHNRRPDDAAWRLAWHRLVAYCAALAFCSSGERSIVSRRFPARQGYGLGGFSRVSIFAFPVSHSLALSVTLCHSLSLSLSLCLAFLSSACHGGTDFQRRCWWPESQHAEWVTSISPSITALSDHVPWRVIYKNCFWLLVRLGDRTLGNTDGDTMCSLFVLPCKVKERGSCKTSDVITRCCCNGSR